MRSLLDKPRCFWRRSGPMLLPQYSRPKYPWRSLGVGEEFFVPYTEDEFTYKKLQTQKRKAMKTRARVAAARFQRGFLITRANLGLVIRRVK